MISNILLSFLLILAIGLMAMAFAEGVMTLNSGDRLRSWVWNVSYVAKQLWANRGNLSRWWQERPLSKKEADLYLWSKKTEPVKLGDDGQWYLVDPDGDALIGIAPDEPGWYWAEVRKHLKTAELERRLASDEAAALQEYQQAEEHLESIQAKAKIYRKYHKES